LLPTFGVIAAVAAPIGTTVFDLLAEVLQLFHELVDIIAPAGPGAIATTAGTIAPTARTKARTETTGAETATWRAAGATTAVVLFFAIVAAAIVTRIVTP
jgi:hypothetical protein